MLTGQMPANPMPIHGIWDENDPPVPIPVYACPTCSGAGKLVDQNDWDVAWHRKSQLSLEGPSLFWDGVKELLMVLQGDAERAKGLALRLRDLADEAELPFDEQWVRGNFLDLLRQIKEECDSVSWEDMRQVTVRLFPQLQTAFAGWRTFLMACRRARPMPESNYEVRIVRDGGKGWVVQRRASAKLPEDESQDPALGGSNDGEMGQKRKMGSRWHRIYEEWRQLMQQHRGGMSTGDRETMDLLHRLISMTRGQALDRGSPDAKMLRRCDQLLRILRKSLAVG